jgi:glycosyltransferase involved in cell wall biosynthesis
MKLSESLGYRLKSIKRVNGEERSFIFRIRRFLKLYLSSFTELFLFSYQVRLFFSSHQRDKLHGVEILSASTPAILFIDSSIPPTDRDAGAVSISQFMILFASQGWTVYLWPLDQIDQPEIRKYLELQKVQTILSANKVGLRTWLTRNSPMFKVIFLNRPAMAASLLSILPQGKYKLAYYGHDLHGHRFEAEAQQTGQWEIGCLANRFKRLERNLSRAVDYCYYPSFEEVAEVKKSSPTATVKELPPYFFDFKHLDIPSPPAGANLLFIGNFSHFPNVDAATWLVQDIWPRIRERVNNVQLTIAGSGPPQSLINLIRDTEQIELTGWVSEKRLRQLYSASRIAIIPLRFGAGVKHKVVSAVVRGCPIVTTETGIQGLRELQGSVGLANSADQIASECQQLIVSDDLWSFRLESARRALADRFTADSMWQALVDLHRDA